MGFGWTPGTHKGENNNAVENGRTNAYGGRVVRLKFKIIIDNKPHDVEVKQRDGGSTSSPLAVAIDGKTFNVTVVERDEKTGTQRVKVGEKEFRVGIEDKTIMSGKPLTVKINEAPFEITVDTLGTGTTQAVPKITSVDIGGAARREELSTMAVPRTVAEGEKVIVPPMPGKIVSIKVKEGESVRTGDVVLILEAMKMANEIASPFEGKVKEVRVSNGQSVTVEDVLIVIE
jgi:biotin carboxyl carrier protein